MVVLPLQCWFVYTDLRHCLLRQRCSLFDESVLLLPLADARKLCVSTHGTVLVSGQGSNLVDPASSHMLVSKIKPCMSQYKLLYGETANGSLKQL